MVRSSGAVAASATATVPSSPGESGEVGRVGSRDGSGNGAQRIIIRKEVSHGGLAHCRKLARRGQSAVRDMGSEGRAVPKARHERAMYCSELR